MLKRYKDLYLGIMIPTNIFFCISLILAAVITVLNRGIIELCITLSVFLLSGLIIAFFPGIMEKRIINKLFPMDTEEVRIRINQKNLRKDYDALSETAKEIFQISLKEEGNPVYLFKHDVDEDYNRYRLYVKSKYSSCIIYDSQKNPNCIWLLKYSKFFEVN